MTKLTEVITAHAVAQPSAADLTDFMPIWNIHIPAAATAVAALSALMVCVALARAAAARHHTLTH